MKYEDCPACAVVRELFPDATDEMLRTVHEMDEVFLGEIEETAPNEQSTVESSDA